MYKPGNVLYIVSVQILVPYAQEWVEWMKDVHIPDVLNTGLLDAVYFAKLSEEAQHSDYSGFEICYVATDLETYAAYHKEFAPALQAEHSARYAGRFKASRRLAEIV